MSLKATVVHSVIAADAATLPPRIVMPAVAGANGHAMPTLFSAWAVLLTVKAELGLGAAVETRRHLASILQSASNGRAPPPAAPDPQPQTRAQRRRARRQQYETSAALLEKLRSHPDRYQRDR